MASIVSVEQVSVSLPDGTSVATVALTKGQAPAKCVPFSTRRRSTITAAANNYDLMNAQIDVFDNAGTPTVRVTVDSTSQQTDWSIFVVEFGADVNVQTGVVTSQSGGSVAVAVTAVDQGRAAIVWTGTGNGSGSTNAGARSIRARFTSDTEITLSRFKTAGTFRGRWYVFEDTAGVFSVQSGTIAMIDAVDTTKTATISAVTTSKAWVLASLEYDGANSNVRSGAVRVDLQNSTTVRALRNDASQAVNVSFFVIEFDASGNGNVQRGLLNFGTTGNQLTAAISSVDLTRAMVNSPVRRCHEAAGELPGNAAADVPDCIVRLTFNGPGSQVVADRTANGTNGSNLAWEAVEWPVAGDVNLDFALGTTSDLSASLDGGRGLLADVDALATLDASASVERAMDAALGVTADFQASITLPTRLAFSFQANADFAGIATHDLELAAALSADVQISAPLETAERLLRFDMTATADLGATLDGGRGLVADVDAAATAAAVLGVGRKIIVTMSGDANFQEMLVRESPRSFTFDALAEFADLLGAERPIAASLDFDIGLAAAVDRERDVAAALEADIELVASDVIERRLVADVSADADMDLAAQAERPLAVSLAAQADHQAAVAIEKALVAALEADADLAAALDGGRGVALVFQADADFQVVVFDGLRFMRFSLAADADLAAAFQAERPLAASSTADADLAALLGKDFDLGGFSLAADADFQALALRDRGYVVDVQADADFSLAPLFGRNFSADVQADADFSLAPSLDVALVAAFGADAELVLRIFTDRLPGSDVFVIPAPIRNFVIPVS